MEASTPPTTTPPPESDDGSDWLVGDSDDPERDSPVEAAGKEPVAPNAPPAVPPPTSDPEQDETTRPARKRYPHQVHVDAGFVRTRMVYRMSLSYDFPQPNGFAEGKQVEEVTTNGLGFLASVGWTWRFIGVGAELLQSWGEETTVHADVPPDIGDASSTVRPSWTSVAVYADLRPFQRWLSVRPGVGLGGVALRETGDFFDAEGRFGLVPHISARLSVPVDERFRLFGGLGARVMWPSVFEFGGSLVDWRLGVELN